jgi:hypothetical protein
MSQITDRRTVEHSALSGAQRSARARLAANSRWAGADRVEGTHAARAAFLARFERQVDPGGVLDPLERERRAESAKRAYFQRMAFARRK